MGELGGTVEYLYWSNRRTSRFLEDNNVAIPAVTRTVASPAFSWLPTFSRSTTNPGNRRPQIAKAIEGALGQIAVTRFNAPGSIEYAKGTSTVVFGEFITLGNPPPRQPAVMFTALDYDRKHRESVAVCLYGSMDNFPEYVQAAGPGFDGGRFREGWVSSAAREIFNFLNSHGEQLDDPYYEPEDMAVEALKVADGQGMYEAAHDAELGTKKPWKRAFTYGDARKAEWLAQIYLDVDLQATEYGPVNDFRRVLIGAPLWIRTPHPRAIRLYATSDDRDVVADRQIQARRGSPSAKKSSSRANSGRTNISRPTTVEVQADDESEQEISVEPTITLPHSLYRTLKAGFVKGAADWVMRRIERMPADDRIPHLGDHFGRVFAWIWNQDKDQAMILLSDYLGELREAHLLADQIDPESVWMKFFGDSDSLCHLVLTITTRSLAWLAAMFVSITAKIQTARVKCRMTSASVSFGLSSQAENRSA